VGQSHGELRRWHQQLFAAPALVHPHYKNWGKRIRLAYSLSPKTAIRSSYGISYVLFMSRPYVFDAQITQSPSCSYLSTQTTA
jgi:hypothetical protein